MHARAALLHVHSCRAVLLCRVIRSLWKKVVVCTFSVVSFVCSLYMHIRFANNARISGAPKRPDDIPGSERVMQSENWLFPTHCTFYNKNTAFRCSHSFIQVWWCDMMIGLSKKRKHLCKRIECRTCDILYVAGVEDLWGLRNAFSIKPIHLVWPVQRACR